MSTADRAWQALRANVDDLRLGDEVARVGMFLASGRGFDDSRLAQLLRQLAAERGAAEAFELIVARYLDAHSRRLAVTPPAVAELMARLACPDGGGCSTRRAASARWRWPAPRTRFSSRTSIARPW